MWTTNSENLIFRVNCLNDQNDDDHDEGGRWDNFVHAVVKRAMDDNGFGNGSSWHELIDICIISNLNAPLVTPLTIDPNDPSTFNRGLSLQAGLYCFGFAIKGLGYVPFILEVETPLNVTMAMADMLSVNIYPVPITSNSFTIDMTASEALSFTYEFRNSSGTLLYKQKFNLKKNQQWTHVVKPTQGVPNGKHINRFVFTDGSVLSLQTIK